MCESAWQAWQHRKHLIERRRWLARLRAAAMRASGTLPEKSIEAGLKVIARVDLCCSAPTVCVDRATGQLIRAAGRCDCRACMLCGPLRAKAMQAAVERACGAMDSPRFLTLTLRSTDTPLSDQLDRLRQCFKALRRRQAWKEHVRGGLAVVEVQFNVRAGTWHPHLHVLIDGRFWPQREISSEWLAVTGDSPVVDIRMVHSAKAASRYVAKYVSKSGGGPAAPPVRKLEYVAAMKGLRVHQTFGSMHGVKLAPERPKREQGVEVIGRWDEVLNAENTGDHRARRLRIAFDLLAARSAKGPALAGRPEAYEADRRWAARFRRWRDTRRIEHENRMMPPRKPRPKRRPPPPPRLFTIALDSLPY